MLIFSITAFADEVKSTTLQSRNSDKPTANNVLTNKKPPPPRIELNTVFKKSTVTNPENPVICRQTKRENSRIRGSKRCMTKTQWKKQKASATKAVSGRL